MADIELVVKIPEEMWERIKDGYVPLGISKYLQNGTPLPKGHGDLIDVDNIQYIQLEDSLTVLTHTKGDEVDWYIEAPTIIEADKAESEDKE